MGGASFRHNRLVANLIVCLGTRLREGPCAVYASRKRYDQVCARLDLPSIGASIRLGEVYTNP
ncbi:MAG: hypothetical protein AB1758_32760 [Candidatus Eremiobacterota bacterium]